MISHRLGDIPRVEGDLAVTRALGDWTLKKYVINDPHLQEVDLQPGHESLILACDGVWDVISDQEAIDLIKNIDNPQQASELLKDEALKRGSTDNISVIVVKLKVSP